MCCCDVLLLRRVRAGAEVTAIIEQHSTELDAIFDGFSDWWKLIITVLIEQVRLHAYAP